MLLAVDVGLWLMGGLAAAWLASAVWAIVYLSDVDERIALGMSVAVAAGVFVGFLVWAGEVGF